MHDITKLFLAERFNAKITSPDIHFKAIEALEHFINDEELKKRLLRLLKEAKDIYFSAERLKENTARSAEKRKAGKGRAQHSWKIIARIRSKPQEGIIFP